MKTKLFSLALIFLSIMAFPSKSFSQYYAAANALQSVLSPALSGSGRYKGFVEAGYTHTLGNYKGDFLELSTSQGYQYNNWFFMGAGLGVDILFSQKNDKWGEGLTTPPSDKPYILTAPMLPLFTDFRFNIGNNSSVSFFLDLKIGCSFLLSNKYVAIGDGYLTNREYFFLNPAIGLRLPVNKKNPKQAFDFGVRYKLLTSNYWYQYNNNITLQSLGAFLAFEW
ncbi:MAG: hypothetical protein J1E95_07460 [Muribaculaceae bacterium]|nr:hypothetical protein [Muribaculaceae bacterium]